MLRFIPTVYIATFAMVCCDVVQNVRSAAPSARDRREYVVQSSTTGANTLSSATSSAAASMFTTTPAAQYDQFVRLQQLLMHMQTNGRLQLNNGTCTQVR